MRSPLVALVLLLSLIAPLYAAPSPAPTPSGAPGTAQGPAGLDCESATSPEEVRSKLTANMAYRAITLLLRVGIYHPAAEGLKNLVAQTHETNALLVLESRLLPLMEELGQHTLAVEGAEKTLAMLKQASVSFPSTELMLDLSLLRSGSRAARPEVVRTYLERATRVANTLDTPTSQLARFIVMSYAFGERFKRNPSIDPKTLTDAHDAAWAVLRSVPQDARLAPFVMTWVGDAARIWMVAEVRVGVASTHDVKQQTAMVELLKSDITALTTLLTRRMDPEMVVALVEAVIDCAHEATEAREYATAESLLKSGQDVLDAYENALVGGWTQAGIDPHASAAARTRARLLHEQADLLIAWDPKKNAAEASALLERASTAATLSQDALRVIEIDNDQAAILVRARTDGWQALAATHIERALAASRELNFRPGIIAALGNRGELLALRGDRAAAIKDLTEAVSGVEQYINELGPAGAAGVRKAWSRIYDLLARLQVESGQAKDALATLDRGQELSTRGALDNVALSPRDPALRNSLQRAVQARERTRALQQELTEQTARGNKTGVTRLIQLLANSKQQFFAELGNIRARDPDYERLLAVRPVNFAAIQDSIPNDTVMVQVFPSTEKLYLFIVTAKSFKIVSVNATRAEIESLVADFRGEIAGFRPQGRSAADDRVMRNCLTALYGLLVEPIEKDLEGKDVVAFIPTGTLFYLPLQALARERDGKLEFLVERKQVAVLAKASDVAQLRDKPVEPQGRLVAFGNPDGSLQASEREAKDVAALFPGAQVYVGTQATAQKLLGLQGGVSYLHLATHGILDARDPNASYMVMAGGDDSSRLRVSDIFGLPLHGTRMVTLSACQTALATSNPGSELSSLAEAFSIAGSPTVVASLWRVADASTRELMIAFYQNLHSGMSRARALQQAQLQMLRGGRFAHPFYWAPFVILGDWR